MPKTVVIMLSPYDPQLGHRGIGAGGRNGMFVDYEGGAWAWGLNDYGQLGNNTVTPQSSPVSVVGGHKFIKLSQGSGGWHCGGIKEDGSAWMWGYNSQYQIGDITLINRSSPVSVAGGHSFTKLCTGNAVTLALRGDGTSWGWGYNSAGPIGMNIRFAQSSPVSTLGGHSYKDLAICWYSTSAVGVDGVAWSWGWNANGQLGINTAGSYWTSPMQVLGLSSNITACAAGDKQLYWLDTSGQVWGCGDGAYGALGTNELTDRSSPVSVVGGHSFSKIFAGYSGIGGVVVGLKADGSAWSWGYNSYGNLGDGTTTHRSSPVSVVGGHSFTDLKVGYLGAVYGYKADETIWAWGNNVNGQLGDNTTTSRSSPVSVCR